MKIIHVWIQEGQDVERLTKSKIEDLKVWDLTRICNSGRISGATDKGVDNGARQLSTPEAQ
jgi:hypothetical protein